MMNILIQNMSVFPDKHHWVSSFCLFTHPQVISSNSHAFHYDYPNLSRFLHSLLPKSIVDLIYIYLYTCIWRVTCWQCWGQWWWRWWWWLWRWWLMNTVHRHTIVRDVRDVSFVSSIRVHVAAQHLNKWWIWSTFTRTYSLHLLFSNIFTRVMDCVRRTLWIQWIFGFHFSIFFADILFVKAFKKWMKTKMRTTTIADGRRSWL